MALLTLKQAKQMQVDSIESNLSMDALSRKYGISRSTAIDYLRRLRNQEDDFFVLQESRTATIEKIRACAEGKGLAEGWRAFIAQGGNLSREQFRTILSAHNIPYKKNVKTSGLNSRTALIKADLLEGNFVSFASLAAVHDVSNNYVGVIAKELGIKAKCPRKEGLREDIKTVLKGCEKPLSCREIGRILQHDVIKVRALVYHIASCGEIRAARRGSGKVYMHEDNVNIEDFDWNDVVAAVKAPVKRKSKNTQPYKPNYTLLQKIALGMRV